MKKARQFRFTLGTLLLLMLSSYVYSQTWQKKADFGGGSKFFTAGFSIGSKGYMGLGSDFIVQSSSDFWEYDPATNTWRQIADFGGTPRRATGAFAVGGKGYIGAGWDGLTMTIDFWEYNPVSNAWTKKADFPGLPRRGARGEAIGTKGYMGFGWNGADVYSDFYEYDPATDVWAKKADYLGGPIAYPSSFVIGAKAFFGTGFDGFNVRNDFYEYDPALDTWTPKANYGGVPQQIAVGFSIGNEGYIGNGRIDPSLAETTNQYWKWNQATDSWSQVSTYYPTVADVPGSFSIPSLGKAYVGSGGGTSEFFEFVSCFDGAAYRPTLTYTGEDTLCIGTTISLSANTQSSYLWSTGETTQSINALTVYGPKIWVVNPDQNNCVSDENSIQITNIVPWYIETTGPLTFCSNESATLIAHAVYARNDYVSDQIHDGIVWSNGETTESINVSKSGIYTFSVYGCEDANIAVPVTVISPPNCLAPDFLDGFAGAAASTNKEVKGTFYWTKGVCATGWQFQYRKAGDVNWITRNIKPTSYNTQFDQLAFVEIIGLKRGVCYEYRVRSQCNAYPTAYSDWTYPSISPSVCTSPDKPLRESTHADAVVIDESVISNLTLAPNPAAENLTLHFETGTGTARVLVFNMTGQQVMEQNISSDMGQFSQSFDVSSLSKGIYLVTVVTESDRVSSRFVKE